MFPYLCSSEIGAFQVAGRVMPMPELADRCLGSPTVPIEISTSKLGPRPGDSTDVPCAAFNVAALQVWVALKLARLTLPLARKPFWGACQARPAGRARSI